MLIPRRIESAIKPQTTENLGDGYWYYNYDIQSRVVTMPPKAGGSTETEELRYSFIQVKMFGEPDYKKCVDLIIRKHITQNQEFDLINSYNKAVMNMLSEVESEKAKNDYHGYLELIADIKTKVKQDFETDEVADGSGQSDEDDGGVSCVSEDKS